MTRLGLRDMPPCGMTMRGARRASVLALLFLLVPLHNATVLAQPIQRSNLQGNSFWLVEGVRGFEAWTLNGTSMQGSGSHLSVELSPRAVPFHCNPSDIDGGRTRSTGTGLCGGHDPISVGRYRHGLSYYNGGAFLFGTLLSPIHAIAFPVDHLIASWDATTPPGTWLEVHARLRVASGWTAWYRLPIWASGTGTVHRHSVDGQRDVATDTIGLGPGREATAYQLELTLFTVNVRVSPSVRLVAAIASHDASRWPGSAPDRSVWGIDLPVPRRSQMLPRYRGLRFGGGGEAWCSPTSTSMVMAYWAAMLHRPELLQPVPAVAAGVYDATYDSTGNWPFNTAYAASFGLTAFVTRMSSMRTLEEWIGRRVPIVISVAFKPGELPGEPLGSSDGHLMVVRGFTRSGDAIVNDPAAADDGGVRMIFSRAALERVWQQGSHGTAYVIYPAGWPTPPATVMDNP
ncbi:MAG TPA: peptidase C39 family protein [Chloroflexota bacterium]